MTNKQINKKSAYTCIKEIPGGDLFKKNPEIVPSDSYSETFSSIFAVTIKKIEDNRHTMPVKNKYVTIIVVCF